MVGDDDLGGDVDELGLPPGLQLLSYGPDVSRHVIDPNRRIASTSEKDFECLAKTGVKALLNAILRKNRPRVSSCTRIGAIVFGVPTNFPTVKPTVLVGFQAF